MKLKGVEPVWFDYDGAKFKLQPLKWSQSLQLGSLLADSDMKGAFEYAVNEAVIDWVGVEGESGPVDFSKELLADLDLTAIATIAKEVIDANLLGAAAEKN